MPFSFYSLQDFALAFLLVALCVYRVTVLLVDEEGPFGLAFRLRVLLGAYDYNAEGELKSEIGKLMRCPYCLGMWASLVGVFILFLLPFGILWFPVVWLALAGIQHLLQARTDYLKPTER